MRLALVTFHGTLVYFDAVARQLRHAAIGGCDGNVHATRNGADVVLTWQDGETARKLGHLAPDVCTVAAGDNVGKLTATFLMKDLVALRASGRFLSAAPDGGLTMARSQALDCEIFLLIELEDLARLEFILANRWLSCFSGELVTPRGVERHMIEIGRIRLPIIDLIDAARAGTASGSLPRDLFVTYDGWKLEHFVLFRPLAYFVAYGKDEIFQCGEIAIRSLFDFGQWGGDVLVITDDANVRFAERLPAEIRERVHVVSIPAYDVLDYTLARYRIGDTKIGGRYQPVIYIDTDIVCDAPFLDLAKAAAMSADLQVCTELLLLNDRNDYFGKSLLEADGVAIDPKLPGISSGIFAFRNVETQRVLFHMIIAATYNFAASIGNRQIDPSYDQLTFNYVIYKTNARKNTLLSDLVKIHYNFLAPLTGPIGKGFVHFAGGVGNSLPKLKQMANYVNILYARTIGQ